ncbi:MAG: clan AA aspartic protease [Chloroflexota bacterium]|nr:clan AA aspartic protease [Chloroflexota bacterium]
MIEGVVNAAYEPIVTLGIQGPTGQASVIEAVIETGFTGFLTVTPALVSELGLRYLTRGWASLADGSEVPFDVYDVTVLWDGRPVRVEADAADTTPLVGMRLLDRHNLNMDVENGGRVIIQAND